MAIERKPIVFVSCGQRTAEERTLGKNICKLVEELTFFQPYFAQNQSSAEGLTTNIFRALYDAAGLIAVLHQRGHVSFERDGKPAFARASVFVEQEVALAAFITQVLKRPLHVAAFIAPGVELEGVREHLILNPIEFEADAEILSHLRRVLPTWATQHEATPSDSPVQLRLEIKEGAAHRPGRSEDKLSVFIRNDGSDELTKYRGEVLIPKGVVEAPSNAAFSWVRERSQGEFDFFRFTQEGRRGSPIFPGDEVEVWHTLFPTDAARPGQEARVTLYVAPYQPTSKTIRLK